jgi:hypothetical protein
MQQNFLCKIVKHTGEYFTISNSPYDSLADLYLKIERNLTTGFSLDIMVEYSIEPTVDDKVHDLFVQNTKTKSIKSIPRTCRIRLFDYIQQNPDYFIPDENLKIFKTYTIYIVDDVAMEYAKISEPEINYWEHLRGIIYRHVSCLSNSKK